MSAVAESIVQTSNPIQNFISKPKNMLIDGRWVAAKSVKSFEVYNPATGEVIAHVAEGEKA
jgi:phenylacetaldehyde dehydrogenase